MTQKPGAASSVPHKSMTAATDPTIPTGAPDRKAEASRRGWIVVAALSAGYIGIYLCRKNLSVAVPLLQDAFSATKEEVGRIGSVGTLAYGAGKLLTGPWVDRAGGRAGFLAALLAVALFGAAGAFAPGLTVLALVYGLNRFVGSAGWGAMMKLVPTWFGTARTGTVISVLSLSYVVGGVAATLLARQILASGGGWRAVMGVPSVFLVVIGLACAAFVRAGPLYRSGPAGAGSGSGKREAEAGSGKREAEAGSGKREAGSGEREREAGAETGAEAVTGAEAATATATGAVTEAATEAATETRARWAFLALFRRPQFLVVCALSFTITLMRESFAIWNVDFLTSVQGGTKSVMTAALHSIGFDVAGGVSILVTGVLYDRIEPSRRRWFMAGTLAVLAVVLAVLPAAALARPALGAGLVGLVGLLVYGPYSLLAGVLAVESGGAKLAATAAGIIDATGYLAGVLAGAVLGRMLDVGGYSLGFGALAGVTAVAAVIALGLRPAAETPAREAV